MRRLDGVAEPGRIRWLPPLVLLVNMGVVGLLIAYSLLNLKPFFPAHGLSRFLPYQHLAFTSALVLPTIASAVYLWPVLAWWRRIWAKRPAGGSVHVPPVVIERAANAPVSLAAFCLLTWIFVDILLFFGAWTVFPRITVGIWIHFAVRPLLAGMISAAAVYFPSEFICRTHAWPVLFANARIVGNPRLWKVRVVHRLFLQMIAISFLPLSLVALTAFVWMDRMGASADPVLFRVIQVIILIGVSAALGGAWLAAMVAHSMDRPLRLLERAMVQLRGGDLSARVRVSATDEIGALEEGFNLMAERLSESYEALEERNQKLAEALERIDFLERVKRGLGHFVPDTVTRLIEENPDAPALTKEPKDITVVFLDVEGYTRLSETLTREKLNELIERYFSLYITDIHSGKGEINETAGDGLMILFQEGNPDDHAASAVRTALAILEKTDSANEEAANCGAREKLPPISVNIGISSGVCHVGSTRIRGSIGERWTFTATGLVTNLASRLGDCAKNGQVLMSPETAQRVKGRFRLDKVGSVFLKNVSEPIEVWEAKPSRREDGR